MAQIPQLERFNTGKTLPQNDRINMKAQDQGANILNQTNAVADLGDKGAQMYQLYQNDKIEQVSNAAEMEYTKWNNDQLTKLKQFQGDPTDAYAEYDKAVSQKKLDMISSRPDYDEEVMKHVSGRLDKVISQQSIASDHQRGQQQEIYANNLFESTVKNHKDNLAVNAGYIQKDDPSSFSVFDQSVADIKSTIAKNGIKKGTVKVLPDDAESKDFFIDDTGKTVKVEMSPIATDRANKEISDGVSSSLNVLIANGKIDEARALYSKYGNTLNPKATASISKKMNKEIIRLDATDFLNNFKGSEADLIEHIDSIEKPELKEKVMQLKSANDGRMMAMKNRFNKVNGELALKRVEDLRKSGKEFHNFSDFESDPVFKNIDFDRLDTKTQRAITEAVVSPKTSDDKSLNDIQTLFLENNESLSGMNFETFQREHLVGLSKADRNKFTTKFEKYKNPSASSERATARRAGQLLKEQLISSKYIPTGKLDSKDQKKLTTMNDKLLDYISENNITSDDQIRKLTKEIASKGVLSGVRAPSQETITSGNAFQNVPRMDKIRLIAAYKKAKNLDVNPRSDDKALNAWVAQNKEKVLRGN